MIPRQLPGSPSYLRPSTSAFAEFLLDLGYNTGEFGKNHLGDHTEALPRPMASSRNTGRRERPAFIGLIMSILLWISSYGAICEPKPENRGGGFKRRDLSQKI